MGIRGIRDSKEEVGRLIRSLRVEKFLDSEL